MRLVNALLAQARKEAGGDMPAGWDVPAVEQQPYVIHRASELSETSSAPMRLSGVFPESGMGAVYGPSGGAKSFLVDDMAIAIASGTDWFGHRARQAPVALVILEGAAGRPKRFKAWCQHYNADLPEQLFVIISQPFDLRSIDDTHRLNEALRQAGVINGVVIIDTLAQAAPGYDENSGQDMSAVLVGCRMIQETLGGLVILVHHTGKSEGKALRGHSSLLAALDGAIEVRRKGEDREWVIAKAKDEADGMSHSFRLHVVDLGEHEDGEPITSCVVVPVDDPTPASAARTGRLAPGAKIGLDTLREAIADKGQGMGGSSSIPRGVRAVEEEDWRRQFYLRYGSEDDSSDTKRKAFGRAKTDLIARNLVMMSTPFVWVVGK
jgi:hypothetical protein